MGWSTWFHDQLENSDASDVARVIEVQRTGVTVRTRDADLRLPLGGKWFRDETTERPTVGDWVQLDAARTQILHLFTRHNLLQRREVHGGAAQAIAANVDALLVVTACNDEFNLSRLERYLALAREAGVAPVLVLTKADLAGDLPSFVALAQSLGADLSVVTVNAHDPAVIDQLKQWCGPGRTIALLGSSGVGKSTLLNTLAGNSLQRTGASRDSDDRGRHTTSHRSLHVLPDGTLVIDSPGIRELGVIETTAEPEVVFDDVLELAATCRFSDCRHQAEPGCAVQGAIRSGHLDPRRLASYRKLQEESAAARLREQMKPRSGRPRKGKLPPPSQ